MKIEIENCSSTSDLADFRASLIFYMRKIECLGLRFIARPVSLGLKMHPNAFGIALLIVVVNRYYFPDVVALQKRVAEKNVDFL